jgi:hypothetical protein
MILKEDKIIRAWVNKPVALTAIAAQARTNTILQIVGAALCDRDDVVMSRLPGLRPLPLAPVTMRRRRDKGVPILRSKRS